MMPTMIPFFPMPGLTEEQARLLGTLELAYIGDSVFDVYIRGQLTMKGFKATDMHVLAVSHVNARAQADTLALLSPLLTEAEKSLVRRGRNAHPRHQVPKGVSHREYAQATALETLLGYLYLTGQAERLNELLSLVNV